MDKLEFKAALSVTDAGEITGIAWPFGSADMVGDVIEKGAFEHPATLPMLFAHDQGQAIGVWDSIAETPEGLQVKGRLLIEEVSRAREVRALVRDKAVGGLSIGFVTRKAAPRRGGGRTIASLDLREISIVAVPSHPGATITSMKAATDDPATIEQKDLQMENEQTAAAPEIAEIEKKAANANTAIVKLTERFDKLEAKFNRPSAANSNHPDGSNDNVEMKALATLIRTGSDLEVKAASSDNDPSGGYFVLPTVDLSIRNVLTDLSPLRGLAEVVTISGDLYERFYSMGKRGAQWVSERDDRPQNTARPDLIKHSYGVSELYAAPVATRQLLDDASTDIASWLLNNATHDFAETEGEAFHTGDGVDGRPKGLLTYPTTNEKDFTRAWGSFQYVPAGHAIAPTDTNLSGALIRLVATLRTPYRAGAVFVMNGNTAIRLRQIVDANNRYLWAPTGNLIEGVEHPLLGYRVVIDECMPDIGAGEHPIAFGDFGQGYVIVDRHGVRVEVDRVTQKGRVIFDTYKRVGGGAGDFNAIKFLKIAAA
jgi:phage prohead protease, HK97 family/phage major capsid protein, HK97 family